MTERDQSFANLIRTLTASKQEAGRLGASFLANVIALAILEAALQWEGGPQLLADESYRLELLLAAKIRTALGDGNVVAMRPKTPAKDENL